MTSSKLLYFLSLFRLYFENIPDYLGLWDPHPVLNGEPLHWNVEGGHCDKYLDGIFTTTLGESVFSSENKN